MVYDRATQLHDNVLSLIAERGNTLKSSHAYGILTEHINASGVKFAADVEALRTWPTTTVTIGEMQRRSDLTHQLGAKEYRLALALGDAPSLNDKRQRLDEARRKILLGSPSSDQEKDLPDVHSPAARHPVESNLGIKRALQEQDRGLENLLDAILRQRRIAESIDAEVGLQSELIDGIGDDMDRTTERLLATTQSVQATSAASTKGIWKYWLVIVGLLIVILILVSVPT